MLRSVTTILTLMFGFSTLSFAAGDRKLRGKVVVDGSSTVVPLTEAVAEEFGKDYPRVRVVVGASGTGGGFKKFLAANPKNRTDINDASRPIKTSELKLAKQHGIEFLELKVAYDGLAVVIHKNNDFAKSLTIDQLAGIWQHQGKYRKWSDVNPKWPAQQIKLYGPGADSGTFDFFRERVLGKKGQFGNFTASEDDNILVRGVEGDRYAMGYFGFAYYENNRQRLGIVAIDGGKGAILPEQKSIESSSYPLSRPLYIYANVSSLGKKPVVEFLKFYVKHASQLAGEVGYVSLAPQLYRQQEAKLAAKLQQVQERAIPPAH